MHHPLSSANNRTPMQLWIRGLHDARESGRAEDIENQVSTVPVTSTHITFHEIQSHRKHIIYSRLQQMETHF